MKTIIEIENVSDADPALPMHCTFSQRGGLIGSGSGMSWQMQCRDGSIPEQAARIVATDGRFAIEAVIGVDIFANGASSALPQGQLVFLTDRDRLQIGNLKLLARVGDSLTEKSHSRQVTDIVGGATDIDSNALLDGEIVDRPVQPASDDSVMDPMEAFEDTSQDEQFVDPLEAFRSGAEARRKASKDNLSDAVLVNGSYDNTDGSTFRADEDALDASMRPRAVHKDKYGFEDVSDEPLAFAQRDDIDVAEVHLGGSVDHVALRPLSRAMGLEFGLISQGEAEQVLEEIGASMREAVAGLNKIYASRSGRAAQFPLASMHMHAIEDNPLRFSNSTDEALHALFAKRGAVYLSSSAAVSESLEHLDHHQSATEDAVNKALDSVLKALLPAALERRFDKYSQGGGPTRGMERDAWCWKMYKAYVEELSSNRQRGLKMLFWEVFGYEYQALMRAFELERDDATMSGESR